MSVKGAAAATRVFIRSGMAASIYITSAGTAACPRSLLELVNHSHRVCELIFFFVSFN